jgi:fructose-1,6-bisphosphatase I
VYGAKTSFVYSTGTGVHGFTLDPSLGEFVLTDENIRIPRNGSIYSVNEGNTCYWSERVRAFVDKLKEPTAAGEAPYSGRYVGSLVADFDRTLRKGGIFLYPTDSRRPSGRLRLLYECMPLAFIAEQAGGLAINGPHDVLSLIPGDIHERSAFIAGSEQEVRVYRKLVHGIE